MLKAFARGIRQGAGSVVIAGGRARVAVSTVIAEPGRSRDNPIAATFLSRRLLNKGGSEKETWHFDFDLAGCGSTMSSAILSASLPRTTWGWSTRSSRCSAPCIPRR